MTEELKKLAEAHPKCETCMYWDMLTVKKGWESYHKCVISGYFNKSDFYCKHHSLLPQPHIPKPPNP